MPALGAPVRRAAAATGRRLPSTSMSEHDTPRGQATGAGRPQGAPSSTPAPAPTGPSFTPVSLRPAVDVDVAESRLAALGNSRSTTALGERADLLRTLGRLDEALAIAEEAFRLAHFTGDRADSTAARIRRAHVLREQGKLERALGDLHTSRITASTEEWRELEAAAAELEGYTLHDLGRTDEARVALSDALVAYEASGAPRDQTEGLRYAVEAVLHVPEAPAEPAPQAPSATAPAATSPAAGSAGAGWSLAADAEARPGDTNPVPGRPEEDGPWRTREIPTAGEQVPGDDAGDRAEHDAGRTADATGASGGLWGAVGRGTPARDRDGRGTDDRGSDADRHDDEAAGHDDAAPSGRRDAGLWAKISNLAANAAARQEHADRRPADGSDPRDARAAGRGRGDDEHDDRRGVTGVTGAVEGLPRDDEPGTWPFPRS